MSRLENYPNLFIVLRNTWDDPDFDLDEAVDCHDDEELFEMEKTSAKYMHILDAGIPFKEDYPEWDEALHMGDEGAILLQMLADDCE